jgi:hypothetical protein
VSATDIYYGVIDEDALSLHGPRAIDGDEVQSLAEAFKAAATMIEHDGVWGEDYDFPAIEISPATKGIVRCVNSHEVLANIREDSMPPHRP